MEKFKKRYKNHKNTICGICLDEMTMDNMHILSCCKCSFCKNCLEKYFQYMIDSGQLRIYCPSFKCMFKNHIPFEEINGLISDKYRAKFQNLYNKNSKDTEGDSSKKNQCPFCEHRFDPSSEKIEVVSNGNDRIESSSALTYKCPNCLEVSCKSCSAKLSGEDTQHDCRDMNENILNEFDIKRCPNCNFLIQREGGCAQISCRNCCHIFCWHCLKSLDNDFLLFHYDSGPCKNKLGHSRLSIFFNRAQTIMICLGISILMLLASPVLLPCVVTKKCCMCCRRKRQKDLNEMT